MIGSMIGNVLDKYEVLQKLGEGGMATVYRGRHMTLGRDVAIKVLHPHLSATERNRQRFAREARAIEHMDHENILKIFDYSGSEASDCYIVTEYVDGLTLQDLLTDRGRLPSEVAALVAVKLVDALTYAHGMGIIHRDLKPENVMLRRDGTLKLMDFGIARFLDEVHLTVTGALVGSPAYMSPEQAMERPLDQRSDLFSLGTLLFHLVTGQLPFVGSNPSVILRNIIDGTRPHIMELAPDLSGRFADTIERLLQTDPDDRPRQAEAVRPGLIAALAEVAIDPAEPRWSLEKWLLDPSGYEAALRAHLVESLLAAGKARLQERDHLESLRLFNRLLSIDEENEEVLSLIQSMHHVSSRGAAGSDSEPAAARWLRRWLPFAISLPAVALGLTWLLWPDPTELSPRSPLPADPPVASGIAAPAVVPAAISTPGVSTAATAPAPVAGPLLADATLGDQAPPAPPAEDRVPRSNPDPEPRPLPDRAPDPAAPGGAGTGSVAALVPSPAGGAAGTTAASAEQAPPEAAPARLTVVSADGSWSYAEISIDGQMNKRIPYDMPQGGFVLSPGTHTLVVRNPYSKTYQAEITLQPGENRELEITLRPLPLLVMLPVGTDGGCEVLLDGASQGRANGLGGRLSVEDARSPHVVELRCPDGNRTFNLPESNPGTKVPL